VLVHYPHPSGARRRCATSSWAEVWAFTLVAGFVFALIVTGSAPTHAAALGLSVLAGVVAIIRFGPGGMRVFQLPPAEL
jgi:hypothetical protein